MFAFFDAWDWRLDDRPLHNESEINPDVLGYIFEKYINQKQMGAYYTKEDITEYISKNTIIPFLFDRAQKLCANAFDARDGIWKLLREQPDRYIYNAVKHGITVDALEKPPRQLAEHIAFPYGIAAGLADVSKRTEWNKTASAECGLPTETWREVVARRKRYEEVHAKLVAGQVTQINDLITLNLDIRQFAQDVLATYEGSDLIAAFYRAIAGRVPENSKEEFEQGLSVLDPTCGSGAFLFAALSVLEPLVETCIERMRSFVEEADRQGRTRVHPAFRRALTEINKHANDEYFILKTIIIGNLYGVDIMQEATEICKLRLFLKLFAHTKRDERRKNMGLEPLPDIDFNIRAGNTLVGFTSLDEPKRATASKLDWEAGKTLAEIDEGAREADHAYKLFREMQVVHGLQDSKQHEFKSALRERLASLAAKLDRYLAEVYGKDPHKQKEFEAWHKSHQPFHWFTEFYGIITSGGFDVIIGNPPYISAAKVRKQYALKNYQTASCSDVYASVIERCKNLLKQDGRSGMIVPLSLTFSGDFDALRSLLYKSYPSNWFSSFARIPAALFSSEVRVRNTIHIGHKGKDKAQTLTTVLHRWFEQARPHLFTNLTYSRFSPKPYKSSIPKINTQNLADAFEQCFANTNQTIETALRRQSTPYNLYFKKSAYNWLNFCREMPPCYDARGRKISHTKFGEVFFADDESRDLAFLFLNGKIMFAFWCMIGDDFDVTRWMFTDFPLNLKKISEKHRKELLLLVDELEELMVQNTSFKLNAGKKVGNYNLAKCRRITDKSDAIFAEHLGLTEVMPDIELIYSQIVKTDFSEAEESEVPDSPSLLT